MGDEKKCQNKTKRALEQVFQHWIYVSCIIDVETNMILYLLVLCVSCIQSSSHDSFQQYYIF